MRFQIVSAVFIVYGRFTKFHQILCLIAKELWDFRDTTKFSVTTNLQKWSTLKH